MTAVLAHSFDLPPTGSFVSMSNTSIPLLISVWRIIYAFKKPAEATAQNVVSALMAIILLPLDLAIYLARAFLIKSPIPMALEVATLYEMAMSWAVYFEEAFLLA